jgi:LacI family transcriptional regulator
VKKITMQQIADHIGVSKFVVSKALSGKEGVHEATRARVIEAASQLGYFAQKNRYAYAQKLMEAENIEGKKTVLVFMPNIRFQNKDSLYWGKVLEGISQELDNQGLGMIIVSESKGEHIISALNPQGLLGIIGVGQMETSLLLEVRALGLPMVLVDHEDPLIPCDTIFANNMDGMARQVNHLIGLGHRQLHFLGNLSFSSSFRDRWIGYRHVLEDHDLIPQDRHDPMLQLRDIETRGYEDEVAIWIKRQKAAGKLPTALVCANDHIALTVIQLLTQLGIQVPAHMTVTGFDNIADATLSKPTLTTVDVPKEQLGKVAVIKLLNRVANSLTIFEQTLLSVELVPRESSRATEQITQETLF